LNFNKINFESTFEIASYMMNKILQREEITIIQMNEGLDFVIINDSEKHIVRIYRAPWFRLFCLTENGDKEYVKSEDAFFYSNTTSSIILFLYHNAFNHVRYLLNF